ncbi:hypothetical protein PR048_008070 [Dryococelus australis]|uniref:Uncharacterized protein n=1 Tax=Dryococelus australis TaxID=614101 RepID=A0ABQ9HXQ1_9NEOP|nr:hypothetical protein PR048_008070 [Dryococelus australis]
MSIGPAYRYPDISLACHFSKDLLELRYSCRALSYRRKKSHFALFAKGRSQSEIAAYSANSKRTCQQNGGTSQQQVATPFTNQHLVTHLPASISANRAHFAARGTQSDTRPVPRASHNQSENEYSHLKGVTMAFHTAENLNRREADIKTARQLSVLHTEATRHACDERTWVTRIAKPRFLDSDMQHMSRAIPHDEKSRTKGGRGGVVIRILVSHQDEPRSISGGPPLDFRMWESGWTMQLLSGFSRGSPVSPCPYVPALIYTQLASHALALNTSVLRATALCGPRRAITPRNDVTRYREASRQQIVRDAALAVSFAVPRFSGIRRGSQEFWTTAFEPWQRRPFLLLSCDRGGVVVRRLAFHLGEPGSIPGFVTPGFSHVGSAPDDAAGRQVFSGASRFPLFFHPGAAPSPRFTIIGSQDLAAQLSLLIHFYPIKYVQRETIGPRRLSGFSLLTSHQGESSSIPGRVTPRFSKVGIVRDDTTGRWVFSGISRFHPPFIPAQFHSSITHICSQDLAVKSRPNRFTQSLASNFPNIFSTAPSDEGSALTPRHGTVPASQYGSEELQLSCQYG